MVKYIRMKIFKYKFQKNFNTKLYPKNIFDLSKVKFLGEYSYGPLNIRNWNNSKESISIGNFVSIANDVKFLLGGNHSIDTISTYPFKAKIYNEREIAITKGEIVVEDDVWIGAHSTILSGVRIGQGSIVGAGSVVTKNVEPYSIVAGNPAKFIRYRFNKEMREKMVKNIDFSKVNEKILKENKILFTKDIKEEDIDKLISILEVNYE